MITRQNIVLLTIAILISLVPLAMYSGFAGTDDAATQAIGKIRPDFKPWFSFLWEPSDDHAPFLFALQAAIGTAFIAYFAWRHRRRVTG